MKVINKNTKEEFDFNIFENMESTNSIYIRKGFLNRTLLLSQKNRGSEGAGDICRIDTEEIEVGDNLYKRLKIFANKNNSILIWNSSNYGNDIQLTMEQAEKGAHSGDCEKDVNELMKVSEIKKQLDELDENKLRKELDGYGAWNEEELKDHKENLKRWLWISCGDIVDNN